MVKKTKRNKVKRKTKRRTSSHGKKKVSRSNVPYRLKEIPVKQIQVWKEAQARKLDKDGMSELAKSIKNEGLQNPPMLQKAGKNSYLLMSGQRRLAALKRLGYKKIPALVLMKQSELVIEDAKAASVVENIHRNKMDAKDTAETCKFLAEQIGKSKAAQSLGMSMATFRKYHGFAGVPDKLKALVPKSISRDEAAKLYQIIPQVPKAIKIVNKISQLEGPTRKKYLIALSRSPRSSHKTLMKRARLLRIKSNIAFKLTKKQARGLVTQSRRQDLSSDELANKIVADWLFRRGY